MTMTRRSKKRHFSDIEEFQSKDRLHCSKPNRVVIPLSADDLMVMLDRRNSKSRRYSKLAKQLKDCQV